MKEEEKEKWEEDIETREVLPYFNNPKAKIGIWSIIKDAIGKDLSKFAVPIYFNDPTSYLQRAGVLYEYNDLLDKAAIEKDVLKRVAYLAIFSISGVTSMETAMKKPFNPLLGETYEYKTKNF